MKKRLQFTTFAKMTFAAILLLCSVLAGVLFYQKKSSDNILTQIRTTLAEDVARQVKSFQLVLEGQYDLLDFFASFYATRQEMRSELELQMRLLIKPTSFYNVGIAFPDERTYSVRPLVFIPQKQDFFKKSIRSERGLEWVRVDGEKRLCLSVPLFTDGRIVAVLFGTLRESTVKILMGMARANSEGCAVLCNASGEILVCNDQNLKAERGCIGFSENGNYLDALSAQFMESPHSIETVRDDFREGRSGVASYRTKGNVWHAFYTPVELNDWIIVSEIPMREIFVMMEKTNAHAARAMLIILIAWGVVFFVLYRNEQHHVVKLQRQQELMKIREDEYRIAVRQSGAMLFRFDVQKRTVFLEAEPAELLGIPKIIHDIPDGPDCGTRVDVASRDDYVKFWKKLISGEKSAHTTLKMCRSDGVYRWYTLTATNIFDSAGMPVQVIASLSDVTEQREKEVIYRRWRQSLEERSPEEYTLFECNLTRNEPEIKEGTLLNFEFNAQGLSFDMRTLDYVQRFVFRDDREAYLNLINRDKLLANYFRGVRTTSLVYREHDVTGKIRWLRLSIQMVEYPDSSDVKVYLYYRDIDKEMKRDLDNKAGTEQDPLTRALTRQSFVEQVELLLAENQAAEQFAFILIDFDNFRNVNALLGHDAGDMILIKSASDLKSVIRPGDLLGRIGGDEFMLCLKYVPYNGVVDKKADQICALLRRNAEDEVALTASLGVAMAPRDGSDFETLFTCADVALSHAKQKGRNCVVFYRSAMNYENNHKDLSPLDSENFPLSETTGQKLLTAGAEKPYMLVLDSNPRNMEEICNCLNDEFTLLKADTEEAALSLLELQPDRVCVALLNANADPSGDMTFLRQILGNPAYATVSVLITVTPEQTEYAKKAMGLGASDCIVLSLTSDQKLHEGRRDLARLRIQNAMRRSGNEKLNAKYRYLLYRQNEETLMQQRLNYIAEHDSLTEIYNRTAFFRLTQETLSKNHSRTYALARFDINRFKVINDFFGHDEGDRLLRYLAQSLQEIISDQGLCCRTDADNFAFCVPYSEKGLLSLISRIEQCIQNYDLPFELFISMGIYVITDPSVPVDAMLDRAALAQHSVKGNAVRHFAYYEEQMRKAMLHEQEVEGDMSAALEENQFLFYLQPLFSTSPEKPIGAEALVRWNHPEKGLISPGGFIPIFERNGFIMKLDRYVWEQVCRYISERMRSHLPVLPISVNMSRHNIYDPMLCEHIRELVEKYGVPPSLIKFEITESIFTENIVKLSELVNCLQSMGFQVVMDDFGSGYSSLNALKDLPVDMLKIDKGLIDNIDTVEKSKNVLGCIVYLARRLDIPVVAEGVEHGDQLRFLRSVGCSIIQGYYFSKPLPLEDYNRLLDAHHTEKGEKQFTEAPFVVESSDKPRILVVDDSAVNRMLLVNMLKDDYSVLQANDGQAAYELLKKAPLAVDLILLDVVMPRMNGYDFLTKVRGDTELPPYSIIVMTEAENSEAEIMALELGANDFLKKPYEATSIRLRINNLLNLQERRGFNAGAQ